MPPPAPLVSFALALCVFLDAASGAKPLWSYLRDGGTHVFGPSHYAERLWSRGFLDRGFTASHYEQMVSLIARLQSGLPVTVVGIGSSIMSDHAGCFGDAPEADADGGAAHGIPKFGERRQRCQGASGFVGGFMLELNRSYPHPGHHFVNLGIPGTDMEHFARHHCFTAALPAKVDLFIIEQHDWIQDSGHAFKRRGRMLEELWVQLQSRSRGYPYPPGDQGDPASAASPPPPPPPFVIISTGFIINVAESYSPYPIDVLRHFGRCVFSCAYDQELVGNCTDFRAHLFDRLQHAVGGVAVEDQHSGVLHWYGMAEFSMRNLMASAIRDDVWDLPECSLVGLFWEDKIHPSRNQGHLMIADALMRYLERSAVYYDGLSAEGPAEGSADRGGVRGRAGMRRPHVPVNEGAWDVPPRRCFSHDTKGGIPVDVSASRGWNLTDEGRGKPGWVSTAMGDRLSIRLDTASMDGDGHVTVTLTYLQSYEGMGVATLSCSGGCGCAPVFVDALNAANRLSVDAYHAVNVTQAPDCVLTLENSKDGLKFKLIGVRLAQHALPCGPAALWCLLWCLLYLL